MEPVFIAILIALLEYLVFGALVGRARGRFGVKAPATVGHPEFERIYRVHQNTLESLVVFVPALWIFGLYVSPPLAAAFGAIFVVARAIYAVGYIRAAEKRSIGAAISGLTTGIVVLWALVALARRMLS
ncbi:MAG TPA: MAPEG family protein [Gammaproteobacteria bacterium]|nr:MAPEG family protein [Gammaproteobacteria bacterium]